MSKAIFIAFLLVLGMPSQLVYADDISSALQETQDCLRKQNCASATTDAGKVADRYALDTLGGNANRKQEIYDISADIMPILAQQADGDPTKMMAILAKAQTDPQGFVQLLPVGLQARIKNAAGALEKAQVPAQR